MWIHMVPFFEPSPSPRVLETWPGTPDFRGGHGALSSRAPLLLLSACSTTSPASEADEILAA